ncbi:MAG: hypothetical protein C4320_01090 [Armatimonadota bacterium]
MPMDLGKKIGRGFVAVGPRGYFARIFYFACVILGTWVFWSISFDVLDELYTRVARDTVAKAPVRLNTRIAFAAFGGIAGGFFCGLILPWADRIRRRWERLDQADKVTGFLGIFLGLLVASPFVTVFQQIIESRAALALTVIGVGIGSAAIAVYALQSMSEVLPWYKGSSRPGRRTGVKIFDTNIIIDGRIYDVVRAGFLDGRLYVPQFVVEELQHIADSHDNLRRQRGKRGLEVLRLLQSDFELEVGTLDRFAPRGEDLVDARLVRLARAVGGDLVTNDHNLNQVAALQEVRVLNLNDLALSLRPNVLPQETLTLTIIREGNQLGQGIGYMDDGTMVVVENGRPHIGEATEVVVTQVIQTERGKLIFAEVEGEPVETPRRRPTVKRTV